MTLQQRPRSEALLAALPPGRRWWSWQRLMQGIWIVLALVLLVSFVANVPAFYQSAFAGCTLPNPGDCPTGLLTPGNFQALAQLHLPILVVASFFATLTVGVSVLYWLVGLLIFWRKSQEWTGLIFSLTCVMIGAIGTFGFQASAHTPLFVQLVITITNNVMSVVGFVFFFIFPTGRFTPRWTWIAFALTLLISLPFVPFGVSLLAFPIVVGVQVYRYVYIYNIIQRQQTKWFVFALGVGISFLVIYYVLGALVPGLSSPDSWYQLLNVLTWLLLWVLLLLSVSVAIMRYRLWDIDVIINRTLVYGSLTVVLVGLYVGLILALQALIHAIPGNFFQRPLAVVASTLVIVALFQPLRHRLQQVIDRRFYRPKYDASRILTSFSTTLRTEVDVDILHEQLLSVVQETMQPTHISLWVRQPNRTETPLPQASELSHQES